MHELLAWGFPERVIKRYQSAGVKALFTWQVECLVQYFLSSKSNLVYSAPTSGGKTMVAEILMLKRLSQRKGTILFVVPFVALAEEKTNYFQSIWQDMNIGIKAFHGEDGSAAGLTDDVDVAVCTIERANILLTLLYDEKKAHQLSMVVVDEIHMLSDRHRGFLLEVLLTKIIFPERNFSSPSDGGELGSERVERVQLVGMSATLPNISDLARWLDASLYTTAYRPVHLEVRVCMNKALYSVREKEKEKEKEKEADAEGAQSTALRLLMADMSGASMLYDDDSVSNDSMDSAVLRMASIGALGPDWDRKTPAPSGNAALKGAEDWFSFERSLSNARKGDVDGLLELCLETVRASKSVLLFCNSKRRCEVCATSIAEALHCTAAKPVAAVDLSKGVFSAVLTAQAKSSLAEKYGADELGDVVPAIPPMCVHRGECAGESRRVQQGRQRLLDELSQCPVGLCPVLQKTLPVGAAYHHAGTTPPHPLLLLTDPRVQASPSTRGRWWREGSKRASFKSSAPPARSLRESIFPRTESSSGKEDLPLPSPLSFVYSRRHLPTRTPKMGNTFLNVATFRQMCGRAGRMGLDATGEAVLMVRTVLTHRSHGRSSSVE